MYTVNNKEDLLWSIVLPPCKVLSGFTDIVCSAPIFAEACDFIDYVYNTYVKPTRFPLYGQANLLTTLDSTIQPKTFIVITIVRSITPVRIFI